jgi:16S rRNA (cytosine967-C5)-methyltransferase
MAGRSARGASNAPRTRRTPAPGGRGQPAPGQEPPARHGRAGRADPARRAVLDVLLAVAERGAYANLLLPSVLRERRLAGRDAALATELCYGTLRGQGRYDAVLAMCSDRPISQMDPPVREVLRLGTHQLLATRVAPHAAVATSVDLAKDVAGPRPGGFVNAVLRRVATRDLDDWMAVVAPDRQADPVGYLAVRHSYPRWIVGAFAVALGETAATGPQPPAASAPAPAALGDPGGTPGGATPGGLAATPGGAAAPAATPGGAAAVDAGEPRPPGTLEQTEQALAAGNAGPRVTLCALPGACQPAELAASAQTEPARWSPFGVYLAHGDPAEIPAVAERRATVQDEASQLAALAVSRAELAGPDRLWLDMCAGPGGKAALLAGIAAGCGGRLLAADITEHRAVLARGALTAHREQHGYDNAAARTTALSQPRRSDVAASPAVGAAGGPGEAGVGGAGEAGQHGGGAVGVVVADGSVPAWRAGMFDRVLADVPCSGLGSLRRRPEARWRRNPGQLRELGRLQRALLGTALDSVRPGGVVGYVTCSPHLAETREVVADVLAGRADADLLDAPALLPEVDGLRCPAPAGKYVQFWPHRHGTDAIFLAVIRRRV